MGVRHVLLTKYVPVTELEAQDPGAEQSEKKNNHFLQGLE